MVRKGGFEPPCLTAPPPQDGVSANSTTSAFKTTFASKTASAGSDTLLLPLWAKLNDYNKAAVAAKAAAAAVVAVNS